MLQTHVTLEITYMTKHLVSMNSLHVQMQKLSIYMKRIVTSVAISLRHCCSTNEYHLRAVTQQLRKESLGDSRRRPDGEADGKSSLMEH